jgi:hypothetical protein
VNTLVFFIKNIKESLAQRKTIQEALANELKYFGISQKDIADFSEAKDQHDYGVQIVDNNLNESEYATFVYQSEDMVDETNANFTCCAVFETDTDEPLYLQFFRYTKDGHSVAFHFYPSTDRFELMELY